MGGKAQIIPSHILVENDFGFMQCPWINQGIEYTLFCGEMKCSIFDADKWVVF